jgi:hypothetical protein
MHASKWLQNTHMVALVMLTFCHDGHDVMFRGRCALSPYDTLQSKYTDHIENFEKRHSYDTGMQTTARSCVSVDAKPTVFVHVDEPYAAVNEQLDCCRTYRNGRWQITLSHMVAVGAVSLRGERWRPRRMPFLLFAVRSMPAARGRRGLSSSFHGTSCILIAAHHVTFTGGRCYLVKCIADARSSAPYKYSDIDLSDRMMVIFSCRSFFWRVIFKQVQARGALSWSVMHQ